MNRLILYIMAGTILLVPRQFLGQETAPKLAIFNVLRGIVDCAQGKQANEEFQKKYDAKRDELSKKQKELQELQQQLSTQGNTMTVEARAALGRNIDAKTTELQRSQEDAEKEFTNLRNEIFNRIGSKMSPIVQQYAKEKNFTLVLDSSNQAGQLFYADPAVDITDDIIKRYDGLQVSQGGNVPAAAKPAPKSPGTTPAASPRTTIQGTIPKAPAPPTKKN